MTNKIVNLSQYHIEYNGTKYAAFADYSCVRRDCSNPFIGIDMDVSFVEEDVYFPIEYIDNCDDENVVFIVSEEVAKEISQTGNTNIFIFPLIFDSINFGDVEYPHLEVTRFGKFR
jgi:hypothetical protein